jgi:DNA-binding Lrp family transcriptional regulator
MPVTYVLINTSKIEDVLQSLGRIDSVKEAYSVDGVHDIIAKIETENMHSLKEIVASQIRRVDNVRNTSTMIVVKEAG